MDTNELTIAVNNLTARVNAIDGAGLTDPTQAALALLSAKIAGVQEDMNQAVLSLEQSLASQPTPDPVPVDPTPDFNALKEDVEQSLLTLEQSLNSMQTLLDSIQAQINQIRGV